MSRKPPKFIRDGLMPMPDERGMKKVDRGGNRLVDVVNPETGYCVGVRSPLTVKDGVHVIDYVPPKGAPAPDVRLVPSCPVSARPAVWAEFAPGAKVGKVVRLTTDEDESLPVSRVSKPAPVRAGKSGKSGMSSKSVEPDLRTDEEKATDARNRENARIENDRAVRAVLAAMGYTGKITPTIRKTALEMIRMERDRYEYGRP